MKKRGEVYGLGGLTIYLGIGLARTWRRCIEPTVAGRYLFVLGLLALA
jgi:hypothetical protein